MLTDNMVQNFVSMAGTDYTWAGVRSCDRPSGGVGTLGVSARVALRVYLHHMQGGVCVWCGDDMPDPFDGDSVHLFHIVARGHMKRGFIPGNIAAACHTCNDVAETVSPVIYPHMLARPDLVVTEWPGFTSMRRLVASWL